MTRENFNSYLKKYFNKRGKEAGLSPQLSDSIFYSLFGEGKRFRPMLCYATAEAFDLDYTYMHGAAGAVECIHTYSLIHDDLPCMDNDDERRGQPTNHKKFDEPTALLAGDALLTEAFLVLSDYYQGETHLRLNKALGRAAGWSGMILGQALDLKLGTQVEDVEHLEKLHRLKTGALIAFCMEAAAIVSEKDEAYVEKVRKVGEDLGLAFQIKDDLMDAGEDDEVSFVHYLGVSGAEHRLKEVTDKVCLGIDELGLNRSSLGGLNKIIQFNLDRSV